MPGAGEDPTYSVPDDFFGVVEIKSDCDAPGCGEQVERAMPAVSPEGGVGVWWYCAEHANTAGDVAVEAGVHPQLAVQDVIRTCRREGDHGTPCGALALHVAIVQVRDEHDNPLLRLVSVCSRHASDEETSKWSS